MDNIDIEKLMRETFREATVSPPEGTWEQIAHQLPSGSIPHTVAKRGLLKSVAAKIVAGVAVACAIVGVTAVLLTVKHSAKTTSEKVASEISTPHVTENIPTTTQQSAPTKNTPQNVTIQKCTQIVPPLSTITTTEPTTDTPIIPTHSTSSTSKPVTTSPNTNNPSTNHSEDLCTSATTHSAITPTQTPQTSPSSIDPTPITHVNPPATPQPATITLFIPNVITPNADGINDCWVIKGLNNYNQIQVQIFTAKSRCIYQNDNYDNHFCGDDIPDGNYFYILSIKSQNIVRRGVLVIKRH